MWRIIASEFCLPETLVEGAISNGRCWHPPKFVGEADLEGHLALFGSDGSNVRRALFLLDAERAGDDAR